jgi:hypothetical protein
VARLVAVGLTELPFQEPPVDRFAELHQRVVEINDLVEPRAEQIVLAGLPSLLRPHRQSLRPSSSDTGNHDCRFEGIDKPNLQENCGASLTSRQKRILQDPSSIL